MKSLDSLNRWICSVHLTASCLVDLGRYREAHQMLHEASVAAERLGSSCNGALHVLETCAAFHETSARASAVLCHSDAASQSTNRAAGIRALIERSKRARAAAPMGHGSVFRARTMPSPAESAVRVPERTALPALPSAITTERTLESESLDLRKEVFSPSRRGEIRLPHPVRIEA